MIGISSKDIFIRAWISRKEVPKRQCSWRGHATVKYNISLFYREFNDHRILPFLFLQSDVFHFYRHFKTRFIYLPHSLKIHITRNLRNRIWGLLLAFFVDWFLHNAPSKRVEVVRRRLTFYYFIWSEKYLLCRKILRSTYSHEAHRRPDFSSYRRTKKDENLYDDDLKFSSKISCKTISTSK